MNTKFMFISKDKQQIKDLMTYLNELYSHNWAKDLREHTCIAEDFSHRLHGRNYSILHIEEYFVLVGAFYQCDIYDLVYWCTKYEKTYLLTGIKYLEDFNECDVLLYYRYADSTDEQKGLLVEIADFYEIKDNEEKCRNTLVLGMNISKEFACVIYSFFFSSSVAWTYLYPKYLLYQGE